MKEFVAKLYNVYSRGKNNYLNIYPLNIKDLFVSLRGFSLLDHLLCFNIFNFAWQDETTSETKNNAVHLLT